MDQSNEPFYSDTWFQMCQCVFSFQNITSGNVGVCGSDVMCDMYWLVDCIHSLHQSVPFDFHVVFAHMGSAPKISDDVIPLI